MDIEVGLGKQILDLVYPGLDFPSWRMEKSLGEFEVMVVVRTTTRGTRGSLDVINSFFFARKTVAGPRHAHAFDWRLCHGLDRCK